MSLFLIMVNIKNVFAILICVQYSSCSFLPLEGVITEKSIMKTSYLLTHTYPTPVLYFNTIGGDVHAGIQLMHVLLNMDNVTCIAKKAHSMGFAIFQTCNRRYVIPESELMQHQIQILFKGTLESWYSL